MYPPAYLNRADVKAAIHVTSSPNTKWDFCNDPINEKWSESDFFADTTRLYSAVYRHANKPKNFKMLVYSGDSDGVCATIGTQNWIYGITDSIELLFKPWHYTDSRYHRRQPGGFLTQFADSFTFVTVHYAGHEVPAYQPEKAFAMISSALSGELFVTTPETTTGVGDGDAMARVIGILLLITAGVGVVWSLYLYMFTKDPHDRGSGGDSNSGGSRSLPSTELDVSSIRDGHGAVAEDDLEEVDMQPSSYAPAQRSGILSTGKHGYVAMPSNDDSTHTPHFEEGGLGDGLYDNGDNDAGESKSTRRPAAPVSYTSNPMSLAL